MDRSDDETQFRGAIRVRDSRRTPLLVFGAVALVASIAVVANLVGDERPKSASPSPPSSARAPTAAASADVALATPSSGPTDARPTRGTAADPTPLPILAPVAAPATAAELQPTGVLVAPAGDASVGGIVADVDGSLWVAVGGGLANVDPWTGQGRQWTVADDAAFASPRLAAARSGGVWLVGPDAIRRFDGERFAVVIEAPATVWNVAEGGGGGLLAQTEPYGLIRWSEGAWAPEPPGRPGRGAGSIVVDDAGLVWTATFEITPQRSWLGRGVSAWDGTSWSSYHSEVMEALATDSVEWLIAGADGSLWAAAGQQTARLARFEAGRWTPVAVPWPGARGWPSAVDDQGRLWYVVECGPDCGVALRSFDGSSWTTWDAEDGLPAPSEGGYSWPNVLARPGYVIAAIGPGLYRLDGDSWRRLELPRPARASASSVDVPGRVGTLAAMSRSEVWAATQPELDPFTPARNDPGLYRFDGLTWHREQLPIETVVRQLALAPDGALWAATDAGPFVRRDGRWVDLGAVVARVVPRTDEPAFDRDCASAVSIGRGGVVYYIGRRSSSRVVALQPAGASWTASLHSAPRRVLECPTTLEVTGDGTAWVTQDGSESLLFHSAGEPWQIARPTETFQASRQADPTAIAVDLEGRLWALTWTRPDRGAGPDTQGLELLKLDGSEWVSQGVASGLTDATAMTFAPDGSLIVVGDGIARLARGRWHRALAGLGLEHVSVAPDGSIWATGSGMYAIPASLLGS